MRAENAGIRRVCAVVASVLVVAVSMSAAAEDFAPDLDDWHGLTSFVEYSENLGVEIRSVDRLDWDEVETDDVVAVVYPRNSPDVQSMASFISDGGRVVVADHYGASVPFLERLSVERAEPAPVELPHGQFVDDHPGWPRFDVRGEHPLIDEVDDIVANYPAVLYNVGGPVVAYDEEGGLIYDMMLGDGRAIVIADPSLFINTMLPIADHSRLVANMWDYLCVEDCRVWLLVRDFEMVGVYDEVDDGGSRDAVEAINETLREAFRDLPETRLLYILALFLVFGTAVYLLTVLRWRRPRLLSGYIERHREDLSPPLTEFDWNVARFGDPDGRINYALPVALLKETFEEMFFDGLDVSTSADESHLPTVGLARRFEERYLRGQPAEVRKQRRQKVEQLLRELSKIPTRHRVFLESDEYYTARDMERLHRGILEVLNWMGLQENYERQTREIDERYGGRRRR